MVYASNMGDMPDPMPGDEDSEWPASQGPMDETQFTRVVMAAISDSRDYIDGYVANKRALATQYYHGSPFGNEEEGRSQVVMTELRDYILSVLPSLLRIFTSGESVVEFIPQNAQSVKVAEQQTDYANLIFYEDNPGFLILHSVFKDALKTGGFVKWRWSDNFTITEAEFSGLVHEQVVVLEQDKTVEILEVEQEGFVDGPPVMDRAGQVVVQPIPTFDVKIRRRFERNRVVVEAVPPEEILIARDARTIETASYVGHRSMMTVSELVAMGYDQDEVEEHAGQGDVFILNYEAQSRNPAITSLTHVDNSPDPSMRRVMYVESYMRIDKDGDGIAELRKICSIGNYVLHDEIVDEVPIADLFADPEPHMVIGSGMADQLMDLQRIKSNVVRATLDSLAQVIHPRTVVVEGSVNMDDVMNTETGAIIRARAPGMVQPLAEPFVGQQAMPVIAWLDDLAVKRTGVLPGGSGLDPDALQSTTSKAVSAMMDGRQERIEMIARIFAEHGIRRMFKGILKLAIKHQDRPRMVKLRGEWVEIDPKSWDADLICRPNVALGKGTDQEKIQFLSVVAQKQEQIIQLLGPMNPVCDVSQYRNTLAQIVTLAGFKDAARYFKQVDPQALAQQMAEQAKAAQQPDPNMELVKVQAEKVQAEAQAEAQKLAMEREKATAEIQLKAAQVQADKEIALEKLRLEHARLMVQQQTDRERIAMEDHRAAMQNETQIAVALAQNENNADLRARELAAKAETEQAKHSREVAKIIVDSHHKDADRAHATAIAVMPTNG